MAVSIEIIYKRLELEWVQWFRVSSWGFKGPT